MACRNVLTSSRRLLVPFVLCSAFVAAAVGTTTSSTYVKWGIGGSGAALGTLPAVPRGGGGWRKRGRKHGGRVAESDMHEEEGDEDAALALPVDSDGDADATAIGDNEEVVEGGDDVGLSLEERSDELKRKTVEKIRSENMKYLEKRNRRRELDKSWLDKAITSVVERLEILFRLDV